jgi:hypothetical protein
MELEELKKLEKSINVKKQGYRFITVFSLDHKKTIAIKISNYKYSDGTWGVNNWYKTREMADYMANERNKER